MKNVVILYLVAAALGFTACSGRNGAPQPAPAQTAQAPVDPRLESLAAHRTDSMEELVKYLSQYEIPLDVMEKEKGSFIGYVTIEKDLNISSGYDGGAPIDVSVLDKQYTEEELIIQLNVSLIRQNSAGERELYYTGIVEARLSKDELYTYFEKGFQNLRPKGPLKIIGTIIKQPE